MAIGKNTADYPLDIQSAGNRSIQTNNTSTQLDYRFGITNTFVANGGTRVGVWNLLNYPTNSGVPTKLGVENNISASTRGNAIGMRNSISNSGNTMQAGLFSFLGGNTSGLQYGTYTNMQNQGNGAHYGHWTRIVENGNGNKYGYWTEIAPIGCLLYTSDAADD